MYREQNLILGWKLSPQSQPPRWSGLSISKMYLVYVSQIMSPPTPIQVIFNHKPRMDVLNITDLNYVSCLTLEMFQGGGHTRDPPQK